MFKNVKSAHVHGVLTIIVSARLQTPFLPVSVHPHRWVPWRQKSASNRPRPKNIAETS